MYKKIFQEKHATACAQKADVDEERVVVDALERQPGKAVVPGGAVRHERVPAARAPLLGDAVAGGVQRCDRAPVDRVRTASCRPGARARATERAAAGRGRPTPRAARCGGGCAAGHAAGGRYRLMDDAKAIEQAGAFAIVIEGVPADLAAEVTAEISIPTIGIGAGPACDGQVLVLHDVLGLSETALKFTKHYADLRSAAISATRSFIEETRDGTWPDDAHSFH